MLVAEAAHQPPTGTRDLGWVEREPLILRDAQVHRAQLWEPGARAVLASAATDAVEAFRLVAHADLLQLYAGAKHRRELANEIPEVHPLLGREVKRQLLTIPLPLGIG